MYPILFQNENLVIDSYSVFFALAWIVGLFLFYKEFMRKGWPLEKMLFALAGCIVGAILGAYIFQAFFQTVEDFPHHAQLFDFTGKTILGGLAGGFIGVEITKKIIGYPFSTGDAFAIAIPPAHALGRIGCLLGGCCFGAECRLPWAITYPQNSVPFLTHMHQGKIDASALTSLPVHPTQIYEIIFNIILFVFLWKKRDAFKVRGTLFRVYLVAYCSFRFLIEFVRGDSPFPANGGLKLIQYFLLIAVFYFSWVVYKNEYRKPKSQEA